MLGALRHLFGRCLQLQRAARRIFGQRGDGFGGAENVANAGANIFESAGRAFRQLGLIPGPRQQRFRPAGDHADPGGDRCAASSDAAEEPAKVRAGLAEAVRQLSQLVVGEDPRRHIEVPLRHLRGKESQLADRCGDVARQKICGQREDERRDQGDDQRVDGDLQRDVLVRRPRNRHHDDRSVAQLPEHADVRRDRRVAGRSRSAVRVGLAGSDRRLALEAGGGAEAERQGGTEVAAHDSPGRQLEREDEHGAGDGQDGPADQHHVAERGGRVRRLQCAHV